MKRILGAVAGLSLLCLSQQASGEPPGARRRPALPLAGVITNPEWLKKPTGEDVSYAYPKIASFMELEGKAMIRCQVNADGALVDCAVLSEQPAGIGFGQAAISISDKFLMKPKTVDGSVVGGAEVRIPIAFRMAPDEVAPIPPEEGPRPSEAAMALGRRIAVAIGADRALEQGASNQLRQLKATEYAASSGAGAGAQEPAIEAIQASFKIVRTAVIDEYALAYARQFSEDELAQIAAHFESPVQKLWLSKQDAVTQFMANPVRRRRLQRIVAEGARVRFCQTASCLPAATPAKAQGAKP